MLGLPESEAAAVRAKYLPQAIIGDLDSIRPVSAVWVRASSQAFLSGAAVPRHILTVHDKVPGGQCSHAHTNLRTFCIGDVLFIKHCKG